MPMPAVRQLTSNDSLPGLAVTVAAYATEGGFALVAFRAGVVSVLQITGPAAVQVALLAHALTQRAADLLVIVPGASNLLPAGATVKVADLVQHTKTAPRPYKGRAPIDRDTRRQLLALPTDLRLSTIRGTIPADATAYLDAYLRRH